MIIAQGRTSGSRIILLPEGTDPANVSVSLTPADRPQDCYVIGVSASYIIVRNADDTDPDLFYIVSIPDPAPVV